MHNIEGAHLQYVNNNKAKFELKGMKSFGVTDYTKLGTPKMLRMDGQMGKMSRFNTHQK